MAVFCSMMSTMTQMFFLVIAGYFARRCGLLPRSFCKELSRLVLNLTMPAMILASVLTDTIEYSSGILFGTLAIGVASYGILFLAAMVFSNLLSPPLEQRGIIQFMIMFGNVSFLGFPVVAAAFGETAVFYAALINLPFGLLIFTVGVAFITGARNKVNRKQWKSFLTPGLISSMAALLFALTGWKFPQTISNSCQLLGSLTTPATLLIIGGTLAELPIRELLGGWRVWATVFLRLLILPLIMWIPIHMMIDDPVILGVSVVLMGLPVATNGAMLCLEYEKNCRTIAQGTFLSTLLSLITVPLVVTMVSV